MLTEQQKRFYDQKITGITQRLNIFVEEVLGLTNAPFHNEIDDIISDPMYKQIAIAIARDHGKSTHLSVAYPLWLLAKNHNARIIIIGSTATSATKFLTEILNNLESNEEYKFWARCIDPAHKGVIPKMRKVNKREEKWSSESITIDRDNLNLKDASIQCVGLFGSILGGRADVIIGDDIVNQENSRTFEQREKIKDYMMTTVLPLVNFNEGGRFIYLGNTWNVDDFISDLLKDPHVDYKKRLPAIVKDADRQDLWLEWARIYLNEDYNKEEREKMAHMYYSENKEEMDRGVEILWPERFTYNQFFLERLRNPYTFARMRQCDPASRPDQKIKEEWMEKAKVPYLKLQSGPQECYTFRFATAGLDLAIGEKETNDDTCYLKLDSVKYGDGQLLHTGDYVIRDIWRGKKTPADTREHVKTDINTYMPDGVRVESVAYQKSIVLDLGNEGYPVRGYHTGGEKNDPDVGVNSLAILLELGKLKLPFDTSDPNTVRMISMLMDEMRRWPDGHTGDSLMALWFAYAEMRDLASGVYTVPTTYQHKEQSPEAPKLTQEEIDKKIDQGRMLEAEYERGLMYGRKAVYPNFFSRK